MPHWRGSSHHGPAELDWYALSAARLPARGGAGIAETQLDGNDGQSSSRRRPQLAHDHEAGAVGEREVLVLTLKEERLRLLGNARHRCAPSGAWRTRRPAATMHGRRPVGAGKRISVSVSSTTKSVVIRPCPALERRIARGARARARGRRRRRTPSSLRCRRRAPSPSVGPNHGPPRCGRPGASHRPRLIEGVFGESHPMVLRLVHRHDLERRPTPVDDGETGALPHAFHDVGSDPRSCLALIGTVVAIRLTLVNHARQTCVKSATHEGRRHSPARAAPCCSGSAATAAAPWKSATSSVGATRARPSASRWSRRRGAGPRVKT